jgi:hypothetical protein
MDSPAVAATVWQRVRPRVRAAGIHMSLSLVVFAVALYLILVRWYPGFHFRVDGGWQGVRIMAAVDLVLGPMLTLIIFNPLKARRLIVFDLSCIAVVQIASLAWGFYAIHGQQPVSINYYAGVFYSMPMRSQRAEPTAAAALQQIADRPRPLVYVAGPADQAEGARVAERTERKLLRHEDPFFFRAFGPHWAKVQEAAADPARVRDPQFVHDLPQFLARRGGQASDYRFFPYQGGYGSCFLALTPAGEPVDVLGCVHG